MPYYLHGLGQAQLYTTEEEALAKMELMMKNLEAQGYKRKAHETEKNSFRLTRPNEGYVDVYVDDEP